MIAFFLKTPINFIYKKMRISKKLVSIVLLILFYIILLWIIIAVGDEIVLGIRKLVSQIPQIYIEEIEPVLNVAFEKIQTILTSAFGSFKGNLSDLPNSIASIVASISGSLLRSTTDVATKIPSFFLNTLLMVVSSFFFTLDYHRITATVLHQFSPKTRELIVAVKSNSVTTIYNYLKAYGIILLCTAVELFIGFSVLHIDGAGMLAVLIALIDILPVLGTGTVLIPWAMIELIAGNPGRAASLMILYIVILVIRQILEPKVVGNQVGLPSILVLISMYAGLKLFGAIGIFLLPILMTVVKNLNDKGIIRVFR
ncbi:sporulation integral membrane protein YtvI [Clostridium sporogenes]